MFILLILSKKYSSYDMTQLLEVRDLITKFFTDQGTVNAVNGISYTLNAGEALALVGQSGSGKSVSVLSIMGLITQPPGLVESGEAFLQGNDLFKLSENELRRLRGSELAMIFQDPLTSLNPVLTVGYQLIEAIKSHKNISTKEAKQKASELLDLVGIPNATERLSDYPHQFSGGQRQRIMIAMALSCNPSVLIADEPTTALDVTIQAQIVQLIKQLQKKLGMAIIWITHDLALVAGLVDKVAVMYAGYIVEQAPVKNIYKTPKHPYTLGLLQSMPKMNMKNQDRLTSIEGNPPDLRRKFNHCPFVTRCSYVIDKCRNENPSLILTSPDHYSACWRWKEIENKTSSGIEE